MTRVLKSQKEDRKNKEGIKDEKKG